MPIQSQPQMMQEPPKQGGGKFDFKKTLGTVGSMGAAVGIPPEISMALSLLGGGPNPFAPGGGGGQVVPSGGPGRGRPPGPSNPFLQGAGVTVGGDAGAGAGLPQQDALDPNLPPPGSMTPMPMMPPQGFA